MWEYEYKIAVYASSQGPGFVGVVYVFPAKCIGKHIDDIRDMLGDDFSVEDGLKHLDYPC